MIGVVGTSRGGLVENRTAKERVAEALSFALSQIQIQTTDAPITIVSGGGLVPNYAFDWARKNGHKRLQVVSAAVKSTPKGVERLEIGTSFGDESEQFVGMCQHFVRVGGGPQSHRGDGERRAETVASCSSRCATSRGSRSCTRAARRSSRRS
eukprot:Transcript_4218.p1 GENE.Transcript_4218~~Transcript_4218.p1  ORF type:complete len:170 (-),score=10.22 Transcript_4218:334-792(-)